MTEKTLREIIYAEDLRHLEARLTNLRLRVEHQLELDDIDAAIDHVAAARERLERAAQTGKRADLQQPVDPTYQRQKEPLEQQLKSSLHLVKQVNDCEKTGAGQ